MKAAPKADHGRPAGVGASDLDRILDRLGAGAQEERLLGEVPGNEAAEALSQEQVRLVHDDLEGGVGQAVELGSHRLKHVRVSVADVHHPYPARKVDEAAAFHVPDLGTFRPVHEEGMCG